MNLANSHNHGIPDPIEVAWKAATIHPGEFIMSKTDVEKLSSAAANVSKNILGIKNSIKGEEEYMETLYQVTVVTKTKEIIIDKKLVAVDQENAKFESGLYGELAQKSLTPADVTVVVSPLGQIKVNKPEKTCCK